MNVWDKWADRIYAETDIGRSVATAVSGCAGLVIYLLISDIAIAGFSAIIVFPLVRILAASVHARSENLAKIKSEEDGLQRLYERLSPEEKHVISVLLMLEAP